MKEKAVFLDRDGTINIEKKYLYRIQDFEFTYKAKEAIRLLREKGYKVIVVTNQAGVARGYYREQDVMKLHHWINETLNQIGTRIDGFYYCPHHPREGISGYKRRCDCRKPSLGLFQQAIHDFNIDCSISYVVGDKLSDLIPGKKLGCTTILTLTGYGRSFVDCPKPYIDYVAANLYEAASYYIP